MVAQVAFDHARGETTLGHLLRRGRKICVNQGCHSLIGKGDGSCPFCGAAQYQLVLADIRVRWVA